MYKSMAILIDAHKGAKTGPAPLYLLAIVLSFQGGAEATFLVFFGPLARADVQNQRFG